MKPLPLQITLLALLAAFFGYLVAQDLWFCSALTVLLTILVMLSVNRQQAKTTEAMKRLIAAIRFTDFSLSFHPTVKNSIPPGLAEDMNRALAQFREKMHTLEEEHIYDSTLLATIDSGLLVLNRNGDIEWCNKATLDELRLKALRHITALKAVDTSLPTLLLHLPPGETHILRLEREGNVHEIAFTAVAFRIRSKELLLISLKNIHTVLENNEIEAWQKLIRVLTHEIMNSLAPIISLSETLTERATTNDDPVMQQALEAIHRRSKGLLEFVQNYRKLTRISIPQLAPLSVEELFAGLRKLHCTPGIRYTFVCPDPHLQIEADRTQIEQVLLNLIRNAEEACTETPEPIIRITAQASITQTTITVSDNGSGIVAEALDKIFVPFFTTKPGGSGIGLSLCRQIMTLHKGNITVTSLSTGCSFTLLFPQ